MRPGGKALRGIYLLRGFEEIRQDVKTVAADPEKYHISFAVERNQSPQDEDLLLIAKKIIDDAQKDPNTGDSEEKLAEYINMVDAALSDKPPEAKSELLQFKERVARQLGKVVVERVRREEPKKTWIEDTEKYWREKLAQEGSDLTAEDFVERTEKTPLIRGRQGNPTWKVYDENASNYSAFPDSLKRLIEGINDTATYNPANLTSDYFNRIIQKIDDLNGQVERTIKQELKRNIDSKLRETETVNVTANQNQYFEQLTRKEEYRRLGYEREDVAFLELVLRNPEKVREVIKNDGSGFLEFQNKVKRAFDHLFDEAASNRLKEFEHSWNFYIQVPVRAQIFASIDSLIDYFAKHELSGSVVNVPLMMKKEQTNEVVREQVKLSEALTTMRFRLSQEEELRRYNHNIHYVIRKRLPLEQIATFAQSLEANSVDVLFLEDENVQTACHFYVQELGVQVQLGSVMILKDRLPLRCG